MQVTVIIAIFASQNKFSKKTFTPMANDTLRRQLWLLDVLQRYGKITREEISRLWQRSSEGDGNPLPERSFHNYRRRLEDNFHIEIACNSRGEYYIAETDNKGADAFRSWMMKTYALGDLISTDSSGTEVVMYEDVPVPHHELATIMTAIAEKRRIDLTYASFTRSRPEKHIDFSPAFVRLYRQRWYVVGVKITNKRGDTAIRTYALDRIVELTIKEGRSLASKVPDPETFFDGCLGVTVVKSPVRTVKLKADRVRSQYFRALPFHASQREIQTTSEYSIFSYQLRLTYELVHELLALGSSVQVMEPEELRAMVTEELRRTLSRY